MRISELRACLDAIEAEHGDVELGPVQLHAISSGPTAQGRESIRETHLHTLSGLADALAEVRDEPPFARELQWADPRDTGEPTTAWGPLYIDGDAVRAQWDDRSETAPR